MFLLEVKLNVVVVKGTNDDEVVDFARRTLDEGWHVRYLEVMPLGESGAAGEEYVPSHEIRRRIEAIDVEPGNIAGVAVRTLKEIRFRRTAPDLWATPAWLDEGLSTLETLFRLRIERRLLEEQHRLLAEELRTTSQRVNLFEKVKIPECAENIRRIRIFLGDENTGAVVRSKIAKGKSVKKAAAAEAAAREGTAA